MFTATWKAVAEWSACQHHILLNTCSNFTITSWDFPVDTKWPKTTHMLPRWILDKLEISHMSCSVSRAIAMGRLWGGLAPPN